MVVMGLWAERPLCDQSGLGQLRRETLSNIRIELTALRAAAHTDR